MLFKSKLLSSAMILSSATLMITANNTLAGEHSAAADHANNEHAQSAAAPNKHGDSHHAHWGYVGAEGPEHWGELSADYHTCLDGKNQTPIDIEAAEDVTLPPLQFHYAVSGYDELNNGHTIQVNYQGGSWLTVDGHNYELKQFHFHTPSENHIHGHEFPMEAHLVHADAEGHLAVVAVMFEEGAENAELKTAWQTMPTHADEHHALTQNISAAALLPALHDYYHFTGSLTTPPCTEGVNWIVLKQPVTASAAQIAQFSQVMGHPNNRPLQSLNARTVQQ